MNTEVIAEILICFITLLILSFGIFSTWKKRNKDELTIGIICLIEGLILLSLIYIFIL